MADSVEISPDLQTWAWAAAFSTTSIEGGGRAVFSTSDSEVRYFLERGDNGWLRVTCSHRMGPAQFEFAAPLMSTIEKYFYGLFGWDVRANVPLKRATLNENLREARFHIGRFTGRGPAYRALFDDAEHYHFALFDGDQVVAVDGFGKTLATIRLNQLAVYLSVSTAEIRYSFQEADDGGRLLTVNEREGEGTPTAKGTLPPG